MRPAQKSSQFAGNSNCYMGKNIMGMNVMTLLTRQVALLPWRSPHRTTRPSRTKPSNHQRYVQASTRTICPLQHKQQ